ncbi:outer membrane beta-barrel protein [uncultured Bacteroides sp.]|uniref:outer membrane beta-barrel protein n=1 Tax=uncultured Bacteroides sp. TaxID=162156 RepID=UPI00280B88B2|nr:outer membrane beta-barrel protein [uncultured Bacteroides sp.]
MEEKELWMNKLKEKLADYSEPTPASGWEQLEKELMPPVEKKIYPYRKWMMAAAAVILLAVVSSVSLYFLGTPAADEMRHIQTPALASTPDALPGVQQPDVQGTSAEPVLRPVAREDRLAKADRNIPEHKTLVANEPVVKDEPEPVIEENEPGKAVEEGEPAEETNAGQTQTKDTERPTASNRPRRPSGRDKYHIPTEKPSSQKGTWSMGLGVGNSGGASSEVGSGAYPYSRVSMLSVSNGLMQIPNDQTLVFEDGVPYLRQAKQIVDIKHHQPISFGLSVRKALGKGFSLESGLIYTLLSSDAKLADNDQQIEQKLHYIGIPLRANWNFLDKKLVTLYVSGGGMIEKCVYGKLGSEKETVKPLQFSVSGAVGAQLNATKRVGIYVEPGVAYYFDDGSDIQTIRKENPFNFNIQAGIRLTY